MTQIDGTIVTGRVYNGPQSICYEVTAVHETDFDAYEVVVIFDDASRNIKGVVKFYDYPDFPLTKSERECCILRHYDEGDYIPAII